MSPLHKQPEPGSAAGLASLAAMRLQKKRHTKTLRTDKNQLEAVNLVFLVLHAHDCMIHTIMQLKVTPPENLMRRMAGLCQN